MNNGLRALTLASGVVAVVVASAISPAALAALFLVAVAAAAIHPQTGPRLLRWTAPADGQLGRLSGRAGRRFSAAGVFAGRLLKRGARAGGRGVRAGAAGGATALGRGWTWTTGVLNPLRFRGRDGQPTATDGGDGPPRTAVTPVTPRPGPLPHDPPLLRCPDCGAWSGSNPDCPACQRDQPGRDAWGQAGQPPSPPPASCPECGGFLGWHPNTCKTCSDDNQRRGDPAGLPPLARSAWERSRDGACRHGRSGGCAWCEEEPDDACPHRAGGRDQCPSCNPDPSRPYDPDLPIGDYGEQADPIAPLGQQPGSAPSNEENDDMATSTEVLGTAGRGSIQGLITDWESSVEARETPETFIAWCQSQAQAARQRAVMVPDLVEQFHGRGPGGHAGVPQEQITRFAAGYEESAEAEAAAYERWAADYAAYVEAAQDEMTRTYGREVIASAHDVHQGNGGAGVRRAA